MKEKVEKKELTAEDKFWGITIIVMFLSFLAYMAYLIVPLLPPANFF